MEKCIRKTGNINLPESTDEFLNYILEKNGGKKVELIRTILNKVARGFENLPDKEGVCNITIVMLIG